ncbi:hypothetical protein [Pseudomonas rhodesiae]|uniref:hypothetical protein n=1 Tax=Pseudomonas rhodesiae TaxID=76760 RepID=UPI001F3EA223|nr:hypothetical protein [Pseudomonas rhodesiae]
MAKPPSPNSTQRQQQNDRSSALNNNRGTSGNNQTNAHVHGNRGKQLNPNQR